MSAIMSAFDRDDRRRQGPRGVYSGRRCQGVVTLDLHVVCSDI